jgi:hypothetical protein
MPQEISWRCGEAEKLLARRSANQDLSDCKRLPLIRSLQDDKERIQIQFQNHPSFESTSEQSFSKDKYGSGVCGWLHL